jgi:hypothetical protein
MKLAMLLALGLLAVQAAEQEVVLACKGTSTTKTPQGATISNDPISQGIIINFGDKTVRGVADYRVEITTSDDMAISFSGREQTPYTFERTDGAIDRVTGEAYMTSMHWDKKKPGDTTITREALTLVRTTDYSLKCKPTQRMF